ncbi:MAG: multiheme c-type cytochrome [Thermodesulfobacteriota bacterium]
MGGLSKKAYQLARLRREAGIETLTVDAGGLLFKGPAVAANRRAQETVTAEGIAEAYRRMAFDAVAVARNDLAAGVDFLEALAKRIPLPWLSASLVRRASGKPVFPASREKKVGGCRVAVIGLTAPVTGALVGGEGVEIRPWRQVLPPLAKELASRNDFLILLTDLAATELEALAAAVPEIRLIVQAGQPAAAGAPQPLGSALLTRVAPRGKYLGQLTVSWPAKAKAWRAGAPGPAAPGEGSWQHGVTALEKQGPDDPEVLAIVEDLKVKVAAANAAAAQAPPAPAPAPPPAGPPAGPGAAASPFGAGGVDLAQLLSAQLPAAGGEGTPAELQALLQLLAAQPEDHAGWKRCADCHPAQTSFWRATRHAQAFETLKAKGQDRNLDCLPCHVTYAAGPDDQALLSLAADLQPVGCEACHGPGRAHATAPAGSRPERRPAAIICQSCHTPDRDADFDHQRDLGRVSCPKGAAKRP